MSDVQTCASCVFGDRGYCHWPYHADGDGETHDALFDPMPPWAERAIEENTGEKVSDRFDCSRCPCFEEREPAKAESERCPDTPDMFTPGKSTP